MKASVDVALDDLLVYSKDEKEHLQHLEASRLSNKYLISLCLSMIYLWYDLSMSTRHTR